MQRGGDQARHVALLQKALLILMFATVVAHSMPARADVTNGPVAWWKFNEASGAVALMTRQVLKGPRSQHQPRLLSACYLALSPSVMGSSLHGLHVKAIPFPQC